MINRKAYILVAVLSAGATLPTAPAHAGLRSAVVGGVAGATAMHLWDKFHNHKQSTYYVNAPNSPCPTNPWTNNPCTLSNDTRSTGEPQPRSPEGYTSGGNGGQGFSKDRSIIIPEEPGIDLTKAPKNWNSTASDQENTYSRWSQDYLTNRGQVKIASVNISQLHGEGSLSRHNPPTTKAEVARFMLAQAYRTGNYNPPAWLTDAEREGIRNGDEHIPGLIWRMRTEFIYELWTN